MSNAISAVNGAVDVDGYVQIRDAGPLGMITLRGDLASAPLAKALKATGCAMPALRQIVTKGAVSVAWMSPDELLVICAYGDVATLMAKMRKALGAAHALVADVSDARAVLHVAGPQVREVIAKLAPVDMSPDAFPLGSFRRTRLAQVAAAFHMRDADTCEIVCFRSTGQYVFDLLKKVSHPGAEVGFF